MKRNSQSCRQTPPPKMLLVSGGSMLGFILMVLQEKHCTADALEGLDELLEANPESLIPHLWLMLEPCLQAGNFMQSTRQRRAMTQGSLSPTVQSIGDHQVNNYSISSETFLPQYQQTPNWSCQLSGKTIIHTGLIDTGVDVTVPSQQ
ncbi:hypothetical protein Nmel_017201 [Mimus melanotis]